MNIDLTKLNNHIETYIPIDMTYSFSKEELMGTEIQALDNLAITGEITMDALDELQLYVTLKGVMVLPCSLTLKPVDYPLETTIEGSLQEIVAEIDENVRNIKNTLDLFPIIWENVLMEIPMKVTSSDAVDVKQEGNGWRLVTTEPNDSI